MPIYQRKPTRVTAEQYRTGESGTIPNIPTGVCMKAGADCLLDPHVHTMHENQAVLLKDGDWILPERDGTHFYPCDDTVFQETYEAPVEAAVRNAAAVDPQVQHSLKALNGGRPCHGQV